MRYGIMLSAVVGIASAVLTVFAIEFSGLRPATSSAQDAAPAGVDGEIKGDIDCSLVVDGSDALKLLRDTASLDYEASESCTAVGQLIPVGEPIPGPQGPPGPEGPPGPPGLSGVEYVYGDTETNSDSPKYAVADCPPGKTAIAGGGYYSAPLFSPIDVFNNGPTTLDPEPGNAWQIWALEQANFAGDWSLHTLAVCAVVED